MDGGYSATASQDETTLVYLTNTRQGQALMKRTIGQQNDCQLISDQVFQYLSQPRISHDGTRIAIAGSGEANGQPAACTGDNAPKPAGAGLPSGLLNLAMWLAPGVVYADGLHGQPADMYTLPLSGGPLTRVADIKDDDPTNAWSPDDAKLADPGRVHHGGPARAGRAAQAGAWTG